MRSTQRGRSAREPSWTKLDDDALLDLRLRDLELTLAGTWLEDVVARLHGDLERRGLRFRPHAWLSSEWFSPSDVPGIAVPFYLAHPRLIRLERAMMREVEGGRPDDCIRYMRHECGHAVHTAFRLGRRRRWRELFGRSSEPYPDAYRPDPSSREFVQHLRMYYAQSHPDEDFAETFAVWLQPRARWRKRYRDWAALEKLEYIDELMGELAGSVAPVRSRRHVEPLKELDVTLREHYEEKRARYSPAEVDIYDVDLRQLFPDGEARGRASAFLRRHRREIRRMVSRWTGESQFTLDQVLDEMIDRTRELDLRVAGDPSDILSSFTVLLTARTMRYHYSPHHWVAM